MDPVYLIVQPPLDTHKEVTIIAAFIAKMEVIYTGTTHADHHAQVLL